MDSSTDLTRVAALIAEPTRAEMLVAMMDGRAHPASDLAAMARVSPSTASHHLSQLVDGGLVSVIRTGRHRYHRLAGTGVAELLESLGAVRSCGAPVRRVDERLAFCRSCYDHMAGVVGVRICRNLVERQALIEAGDRFEVSSCGVEFFGELGIETAELRCLKRPLARVCIDWTERRPHLGGALGAALLNRMLSRSWVVREASGRTITVTPIGRECMGQVFGGSF